MAAQAFLQVRCLGLLCWVAFSCCKAQTLGHSGFSSCSGWAQQLSSQALEHRLSSGGTRA